MVNVSRTGRRFLVMRRPVAAMCAAMALAIAACTGCGGGSDGGGGVSKGNDLRGAAEQTGGVFGFPKPQLKVEYWVAFPLMKNISAKTVTITGFSLAHVAKGVKVLGYTNVNIDAGGLDGNVPTLWDTTHPYPPDPPGLNLRETKYRTSMPYKVPGRKVSPTVGIARFMLAGREALQTAQTDGLDISGCNVSYEKGGRKYRQLIECELVLGNP